jgi:peptidoglycan-N-acetylglucosamine deacetylase
VLSTLVLAGFIFNVLRNQHCPSCCCPRPKHNYKALPDARSACCAQRQNQRPARRKTDRKPSEIPFNTGEGLRAAYYVQDDAASYSSLKEHVHQIDMLFPAVAARRFAPTAR